MKEYSVTYRISPALFAEYCYFSLFRIKNYQLARKIGLAALAVAGVLTAVVGFLYRSADIAMLGGIIALITVMIPFVQKKYIKSRYKLVYGKTLTTYTASFTKNGTFIISADDITEKYTKQDITAVYLIRGGLAVRTANKGTFIMPYATTLPEISWFRTTYGNKFKKCA